MIKIITTLLILSPFILLSQTTAPKPAIPKGIHHPIDIKPKTKTTLPLQFDKFIICGTCHGDHRYTVKIEKKKEPHLRIAYDALCRDCHDRESHHVTAKNSTNKNDKPVPCSGCHKMHFAEKFLVIKNGKALCIDCHKNREKEHNRLNPVANTYRAKGIMFEDDHITCVSCHDPHYPSTKSHRLKGERELYLFCASCHGNDTKNLFEHYHHILNKVN